MKTFTRLGTVLVGGLLAVAAHATDHVTCFDDHRADGSIGVWTYDDYTDWKVAREAPRGTFVFSFSPGKDEYDVRDLHDCFFMPDPKRGETIQCGLGSVHLSHADAPRAISGDYRFALLNGDIRSLKFDASYCPPSQP
ncbi:MAG TPA: hypothetical protein VGF58_17135 [Burkholderiales bacterium]